MTPVEIFDEPFTETETYNVVESGAEWSILNAEHVDFLNGPGRYQKTPVYAGCISIAEGEPLYLRGPVALLDGVVLEPKTVKMTKAELADMCWEGIALLHVFYFKDDPDTQHVRMCRYD